MSYILELACRILSGASPYRCAARQSTNARHERCRRALLVATVLSIAAIAGCASRSNESLVFYTVTCGNLPFMVKERGNLESQFNERIICEVDDVREDGRAGTPILWIVPNGETVNKGDLLVELDSSSHRELVDRLVLAFQRGKAAQLKAQVRYENRKSRNETAEAKAELQVALAGLQLKMFDDPHNGSYQLEVEELKRSIEDINNKTRTADAKLVIKQNEAQGVLTLFELGYLAKSEVDRTQLDVLQGEGTLQAAKNRLSGQIAKLDQKERYEHTMRRLELSGGYQRAQRNLEQVRRNNVAQLAIAQAAKMSADEVLRRQEDRLAKYRKQLGKCKIHAPQDGMVAYQSPNSWNSRDSQIQVGTYVRKRQPILLLPNPKRMQVKTSVHESVENQIEAGLKATVRVDAFPDRQYAGSVEAIAVLPQPTQGGDTKMYETIVTIDEEVTQLKPGMTATVEIHVDLIHHVLAIPVDSIIQVRDETWCYVERDGEIQRQPIEIGRTNDRLAEIRQGLEQNDRVVLHPRSAFGDCLEVPFSS